MVLGSPSRTFLSALSPGDMSLESTDKQDAEALFTPKPSLTVDQPHHRFRAAKIGGLTLSVFLAIIALGSTRSASSALCPSGGVEKAISVTGTAPTRRLDTSPDMLEGTDNLPVYWSDKMGVTPFLGCPLRFDAPGTLKQPSCTVGIGNCPQCMDYAKGRKTWWTVVTKRFFFQRETGAC